MYWLMQSSMVNGEWSIMDVKLETEEVIHKSAIQDSQVADHRPQPTDNSDWRTMLSESWNDEEKDSNSTHSPFPTHHSPIPSAIYNLGTGKARSFYDLAAATFRGLETGAQHCVYRHARRSPGQVPVFYRKPTCTNYIMQVILQTIYTLEEGVDDYVRHYLAKGMMY